MKAPLTVIAIIGLFAVSSANGESTPLTNAVPIITNLVFRLDGWPTSKRWSEFKSDELIHRTLAKVGEIGTNPVMYREIPFNRGFEFTLRDEQGKEVPKTRHGLEWSQPVPVIKSAQDYFRCKRQSVFGDDVRQLFRPDEVFLITNTGTYLLEVRIRLLLPMTNGIPDAQEMNDMRRFGAVPDRFGVYVSNPVRVKVIKE